MRNNIEIFKNDQFGQIRVTGNSDNPMFCLSDICKVLDIKNVSDCKSRLKDTGIGTTEVGVQTGLKADGTPSVQNMKMIFINESNLYRVIFMSRKENALQFQDWVTDEVLPSIRKNGSYSLNVPQTFADALQLAADQQREIERQQKLVVVSQKQVLSLSSEIETMKPKVNYYDTILASKNTVTTTQVAQDYGMSAKALNTKLAELHIQHKVGGQWILYAPYISQGYMHSKAVSITHNDGTKETKLNSEWTQKGRLFLYDELKKYGVLPLIEQL